MQLVIKENQKVTTTSRLIAEKFGKEHKNILRDIQDMRCSEEFRELNFEPSSYKSLQNKELPMFIITRQGFTRLVMGFTGVMAEKFKEEFIKEFDRMEKQLKAESAPKKLLEVYSRRIINNEARNCPDTHFCIFTESHPVMIQVEVNVGSQCEFDLIDGSIGIHWGRYRKGQPWAYDDRVETYKYEFADKRQSVQAKCYSHAELQFFRHWLKNIYMKEHLPNYLRNKYSGNPFMIKRVEVFLPKLLGKPAA